MIIEIVGNWVMLSWILFIFVILLVVMVFVKLLLFYFYVGGLVYFVEKVFGKLVGCMIGLLFLFVVFIGVFVVIIMIYWFIEILFGLFVNWVLFV